MRSPPTLPPPQNLERAPSEDKIGVGLYKQQSSRDLTFLCVANIC